MMPNFRIVYCVTDPTRIGEFNEAISFPDGPWDKPSCLVNQPVRGTCDRQLIRFFLV
jgi:hypothetical protein